MSVSGHQPLYERQSSVLVEDDKMLMDPGSIFGLEYYFVSKPVTALYHIVVSSIFYLFLLI